MNIKDPPYWKTAEPPKDDDILINDPHDVFKAKELPSFVYRAAYSVVSTGYLNTVEFFKDLTELESAFLCEMCKLNASILMGEATAVNQSQLHTFAIVLESCRLTVQMLHAGIGETTIEKSKLIDRFTNLYRMAVAHHQALVNDAVCHYDKFDITVEPSEGRLFSDKKPPEPDAKGT
jgi:hypothetical protein